MRRYKILTHQNANSPELEAIRRPPIRAPPQRGLFRRDGLTPRKPSLGRAVSGAAMALGGRLHGNDLDDHPAHASSGAKRCSAATPLFRSLPRWSAQEVHTRTSPTRMARIGALCFLCPALEARADALRANYRLLVDAHLIWNLAIE